MSLVDEREKANKLNAEGQNTLNQFKGAGKLAGEASQRERATQQKADHSKMRGAAKGGRNAIKGAAMDSLNAANDFNKIRKHAQSGDVKAVAKDAAIAALKHAAREGILVLISNPIFWGVVIVFLFLMFILYLLLGGNKTLQDMQGTSNNPLVISKTGPSSAQNGDLLKYTITVQYPGTAQDAVITDPLPDGTCYVSSSPSGKITPPQSSSGKGCIAPTTPATVTWDAKTLKLPLTNPINITIMLTLKATKDNNEIGNVATVTATGAILGGGGNIPATNDNCHGIYSTYMASVQGVLSRLKISGANYGDPTCQLVEQDPNGNWIINKDKELAYLETLLPKEQAEGVFTCMIPNESTFNANAFNPSSTSAGSSGTPGAFGLLQMNAKGFSNSDAQTEDIGDVVWDQQLTNAINWVKNIHGNLWHGNYTNSQGQSIANYWPTSYNACLEKFGM
jgi:uncharacterized repeat protein (TIGR01451 family)